MAELKEIEGMAKAYAGARDSLGDRVRALEEEVAAARRKHLPGIKRAAEGAANNKAKLEALVEDSPSLFKRPRTLVIHGIRVGFKKGRGEVQFDDKTRVVALIRRHLPEKFEDLVKVVETPLKAALMRLSTAELGRIGARLEETGDQVVVNPADSEIDKLVDALLAENEQAGAAKEAA